MSKYSVGETLLVNGKKTGEKMESVVLKIITVGGFNHYFVKRKDGDPFVTSTKKEVPVLCVRGERVPTGFEIIQVEDTSNEKVKQ